MTAVYREVKAFQEDLQKEGFYKGEVTGRYDAATHEAVKAIVVSGKLGDPVPVPDPAEDAYGKIVAAVAEEMKFSVSSAEAVRTAYSEWAREVQSSTIGLGDLGTVASKELRTIPFAPAASGKRVADKSKSRISSQTSQAAWRGPTLNVDAVIKKFQTILKGQNFYAGAIDGKYTVPLEMGLLKMAKAKNIPVTTLLASAAMLNMLPAELTVLVEARRVAYQTAQTALQALGPQGQAVMLLQALLKKAGLYAGAADGRYTAAVETAFQQWATRTRTTIEAYLAAPGMPVVKQALAAARTAAGFGGVATGTGTGIDAGTGTGIDTGIDTGTGIDAGTGTGVDTGIDMGTGTGTGTGAADPNKPIRDLQAVLVRGGYISGEPDGIYEAALEQAFCSWATATRTTVDTFLSTNPGPAKQAIKRARDAYLASGGQACPTAAPTDQLPPADEMPPMPPPSMPPPMPQAGPPEPGMPEMLPEAPSVPPGQAIVPALPTVPAEVKAAAPAERPKWQKWLIYGTIAAAIGGAAWWYWTKRKAAAMAMDEETGDIGADDEDVV